MRPAISFRRTTKRPGAAIGNFSGFWRLCRGKSPRARVKTQSSIMVGLGRIPNIPLPPWNGAVAQKPAVRRQLAERQDCRWGNILDDDELFYILISDAELTPGCIR